MVFIALYLFNVLLIRYFGDFLQESYGNEFVVEFVVGWLERVHPSKYSKRQKTRTCDLYDPVFGEL